MSCMENTYTWDGGVPYIIGSPVAIPNCQTTRVHGLRVLRNALPKIVAALEPGGSKNIYEGLTEEEQEALHEVTRMGMPPKSWFWYQEMDDGSLPVLVPMILFAITALSLKAYNLDKKIPQIREENKVRREEYENAGNGSSIS